MTDYNEKLRQDGCFNYFAQMVNAFYKILPMRENNEETLNVYMKSLKCELEGFGSLFYEVGSDNDFISLQSILQYLLDNQTADVKDFRREVFKSISICNKLKVKPSLCAKDEGVS